MDAGHVERKLAAILNADVVGYSRLMGEDEAGTLAALNAHRAELIDSTITEHSGRIVKTTGDGLLVEFASVVDAVQCAVELQRGIAERNLQIPEASRVIFRIGINLGDVIVEGEDIFGDGVNVAARLQELAEPGGIIISRSARDQVRDKLDLKLEDLGEHEVKNIARPVRIFGIATGSKDGSTVVPGHRAPRTKPRAALIGGAIIIALAVVSVLVLQRVWAPNVNSISMERLAFPLPDKPSIAVLPFENLSGDSSQNHIPDGITEDIIFTLSQVSNLFVIARNSTFAYKGKPVKIQQVAEELGVRYVLEGSFQRSGETVRITAQLIDALNGSHLWAERYDRTMADLFELQDEITGQIVTALRIRLTDGEQMRVHRLHTRNPEAWTLLNKGLEHFYRFNGSDMARARDWFEKAIEADREYALAYAMLAWTHWLDAQNSWSERRELSFERAAELAEKARALDEELPDVYALKGGIHLYRGEHEAAVASGEKAVALNPNHATNTALLGLFLHNAGRPHEAVRMFTSAMRLSPYYPDWFLESLSWTYLDAEQSAEALVAFDKFFERSPSTARVALAHIGRAIAYANLDDDANARVEIAKAIEADADMSTVHYRNFSLNRDRVGLEETLALLRKLGLPE